MLSKLTRILLAICTAFVFTGQMEAAAEHCARLALAAEHAAVAQQHHADTPPCHDSQPAATKAHHAAHTKQPADHCECIAALKTCATLAATTTSQRIEPYAWIAAPAVAFHSTEPAPDWRPPRA